MGKLPVWIFALGILLCAAIIGWRGELVTDLSGFMPAGKTEQQRLLLQGLQQGAANRVILLSISAGEQQQLTAASRKLASALRADQRFTVVENGEYQPQDIDPDNVLVRYRYILDPRPVDQVFSSTALHQYVTESIGLLTSFGGQLAERQLQEDPVSALQTVLASWSRADTNSTDTGDTESAANNLTSTDQAGIDQGVWMSPSGDTAILLLQTRSQGSQLDQLAEAIAFIRKTFAQQADPDLQLEMTGAPVFATATKAEIEAEIKLLSITGSVLLMLMLWLIYRSFGLLVLLAIPLLSAVLAGSAAVILIMGQMHGITLAFGVTLLGVAIDYPVHLYTHHDDKSLANSAKTIWPTLRLSAVTTVIGYVMLLFTDFQGLIQLGIFNVTGLLVAAVVTCWVLPALPVATAKSGHYTLLHKLSGLRIPALFSVPLVAVFLLAWWLLPNDAALWDDSLTRISPLSATQLQTDQRIRAAAQTPEVGRSLIVAGDTAEAVLQKMEQLQPSLDAAVQADLLDSYRLASTFLPSAKSQQQRQQAMPDTDTLAARLRQITATMVVNAKVMQPFVDAVAHSRGLPVLTPQDMQDQSAGLQINNLLFQDVSPTTGQGWLGVIPLRGVNDMHAFQAQIERQAPPGISFFDLRATTESMLADFRNTALTALAWGGLLIVVLIFVSARSWKIGLTILWPIAGALLITLASLRLLGISLSVFHLIALLLVTGICLDYALFFARTATGADAQLQRRQTLQSIGVSALSTLIMFTLLARSGLPVLQMLGLTVAFGVVSGFVLTFISARRYE